MPRRERLAPIIAPMMTVERLVDIVVIAYSIKRRFSFFEFYEFDDDDV